MNLTEQEVGLLYQTGATGIPIVHIPDHRLIRKIGLGSYGEIWLAQNAQGTYRAVKIVYRTSFAHERPFEREFGGIKKYEPVSRSQEGLMDILQVGRNDRAGYFYYVMELADDVSSGATIRPDDYQPRTLAHDIIKRGRLPFEECLSISLALSSVLAHLHKRGLVHRDVKPSNVIFVNGVPVLADIGLVTEMEDARSYVGTEGFIPPEGPGTAQADVYSLGKVLYEISTGNDRLEYPELPSNLGETEIQHGLIELNEIVIRSCRADPHERYQSAEEMHADLVLLQRGRSIRQIRRLQHRVAVATRVGGVAVAVAVLTLGAWLGSRQQTQHLRAAEKEALADAVASPQVAESLGEMIRGINAAAAGGRDMTQVREILDKYAERMGPELRPHPRIEVELRTALAGAYCSIHEYERAEVMYQKAIALHQQHSLEQNPAQAELLLKLIRLYEATGRPEQGLEWTRKLANLRSTTSSNSIPPVR